MEPAPISSRGALLQEEFRRRDNLEDFVDGLTRTEVFPYPSGQYDVVPSIQVPLQNVTLKPDAYAKLTTIDFPHTESRLDGKLETCDLTVTLTPELGIGTFEISYSDVSEDNAKLEILKEDEVKRLRMALWSRFEWVHEKVEYINDLRCEAAVRASGPDDDSAEDIDLEVEMDADVDLEEEADPYDTKDVTPPSSPHPDDPEGLQLEFVGDFRNMSAHDSDFPDVEKLSDLDVNTLKALFEIKQLKSLHAEVQVSKTGSGPASAETLQNDDVSDAADDVSDGGSKKRYITITEDDTKPVSKRRCMELNNSIISDFKTVAQMLPTTDSDGHHLQAFRQAVGALHIAARILELEHNLNLHKDSDTSSGNTDAANADSAS